MPVTRYIGLLAGLLILGIVLTFLSDRFLTASNIINIVRQAAINGIIAIGMTVVVLTAGIDLSVGSLLGFTAIVQAILLKSGWSTAPVLLLGLLLGAVLGAANGLLITGIGIQPFIATLGMMVLVRGLTLIVSGGRPFTGLPDSFRWLGAGTIGPLPVPIIVVVLLYICGSIILRRTLIGERIYAIGDNATAARYANIPTGSYITFAYALSGVLCAVAGILIIGRLDSAQPTIGQGYELDAIAAIVIGGVSLSGGIGGLGGTFLGVIIISVINNGLNILNVSSFYQQIVKGVVIVLSLLLYNFVRRRQG